MAKKSAIPKKRAFNPKYEQYDPSVEGYGHPDEWRSAFQARMGFEEATRVVNEKKRSPRSMLGLTEMATWPEIKIAYKRLMLKLHPDTAKENYNEKTFLEIQAAYVVLENQNK